MHQIGRRVRSFAFVVALGLGFGIQAQVALAVVDTGESAAPPAAVDDELETREGKTGTVFVLDNDSDPDGDELTVTTPSPPAANGTVACESFGVCEYTPNPGFTGTDGFDYTVSDGSTSDVGHVAVTVVPNQAPVAEDDVEQVTEGRASTVFPLGNDTDPNDDQLEITGATDPPNGTVVCEIDSCSYTPDTGYLGADVFDYTVSDGDLTDVGQVALTVVPNSPPDAVDDAAVRQDQVSIQVLQNDGDPEADELTVVSVTPPSHGTAAVDLGGSSVTYTATGNFNATDSFTYTVDDGFGGTDTATVTLTPCPLLVSALDGGGLVTAERWVLCSSLTANGSVGPTTTVFPPSGGASALFTSGDVANAPGPNDESGAGTDNTTEARGANDVSILRLDILVPPSANCLSFELAFQSEEYPEFVNSSFNDGFLAELDVNDWVVNGADIDAPHNFAFDGAGGIVSVNGSFFEPDRVVTDTGSEYDGSTPRLTVQTPVTPGAHQLYLSIFDAGDGILDSGAFVDRLQAGAAGPAGCAPGANEPPVAADDALTTPEDTPANVNVLANDSDPDGHALTVTTPNPTAQHGSVSCTAAGVCTYTPAADYFGPDSFTYGISDGHGGTDTATVAVTVTPVNDPPAANADVIDTTEGFPGSANVLANDFDVDGDTLTIQSFTQGLHGSVSCAGTDCTYTPDAGYSGPDSFTYTASDGHGGTDVATVAVTVAPAANQPPVGDDDSLTTAEDTSGQVNVLDGDTDPDGDTLTVTTPSPDADHGTVSCTAAGTCTYTPDANYFGPDSFTYTVSDGNGGTDTATVNVSVTPVNDPPNAVNDVVPAVEDAVVVVDVLANDSDPDGDALVVTTLSPTAQHGTVSCTAAGSCTYTPNPNNDSHDVFNYTVSDGHGGFDNADVTIFVTPVNDPPVADDETVTTQQDTPRSVFPLIGDTDPEGDTLTITGVTDPLHGTVTCDPDGTCLYTPDAGYQGPDSFEYTVSDGHGGTDTGLVSVTVEPPIPGNSPPNAADDSLTTPEDTQGQLNVLANDSDPDGHALTLTGVSTPAHGIANCTAAGSCSYMPDPNYNGPDQFTYSISDGNGGSDSGVVNVTVTSVNDNPNAGDDALTTPEDTSAQVNVLANDVDVEGSPLTVLPGLTPPAHGTASCTSAGICTYTPDADYTGPDSFTYLARDADGGTDPGVVSVTVTPVNDDPTAVDDSLTTEQDTAGTVGVLGNDADVDGDSLSVTTLSPTAAHGSVSCTAAGACTYTPDAGYIGPDAFDYSISDGHGGTDTASVAVTVTEPGNTPPSCANVKPSKTKLWPPRHKLVLVTLFGATDPDGDPLTFTITSVTQDEKVRNSAGRDDKSPDAKRVPGHPNQIKLRAERKPSGNGRVYRIFYTVSDGQGGTCSGVEKVGVPRSKHGTAIDNTGRSYNSFG